RAQLPPGSPPFPYAPLFGSVERVARRLRGESDQRVALAQRLEPVADAGGEDLVVERLPALVDQDHRRLAVEPLLDAVEQVHHRRDRKSTRLNSSHVKISYAV